MNSTCALDSVMDNTGQIMKTHFEKGELDLSELKSKNEPESESLLNETGLSGLENDLRGIRTTEDASAVNTEQEFCDLDNGWAWVILLAAFLSFAHLGGSMYSVGIIHNALLERFQASVALTAWVGALHTGILALGSPLSTAVLNRFSCRTAIISSGLIYTVGYMATAFVPCIEAAIFTCGIIVGFGGAVGYTAVMVVVGFNFKRRRNLALGIALSGVGVGLCAFAPLMQLAKDFYGFTGLFICCAGMQLNLVTFGMLCFPSELEKHSHILRQKHSPESTNAMKRKVMPYFKFFLNKGIVCLCSSMFLYCAGTYMLYLHLPKYITTKGFSEKQAAYLMSLSGILTVVGRLLTGAVANIPNCNEIILYSGSMAIFSIATIVYPFVSWYYLGHLIFITFMGIFLGCCNVVTTTVSLKFVCIEYIATALGLEFMFGGVGAIVGPVFAGILVVSGGTYDQSMLVAGICIFMAAVCGVLSSCFVAKRMDINTISVERPCEESTSFI
ncbi:monocarboxylate transporter 13-like isoform X2 [Mya arenaria]|uniref:monocarboxylate transporter 13-like isoform X2 n=1 Tax=Mya arenaria TaxID=6604 RepID=UPI0022E47EFD|nr:monocarboxylate transporter 13-like isoform X2 [Mya arenaria]